MEEIRKEREIIFSRYVEFDGIPGLLEVIILKKQFDRFMSLHSEELFGLVIELKVIRVPVIIEVG